MTELQRMVAEQSRQHNIMVQNIWLAISKHAVQAIKDGKSEVSIPMDTVFADSNYPQFDRSKLDFSFWLDLDREAEKDNTYCIPTDNWNKIYLTFGRPNLTIVKYLGIFLLKNLRGLWNAIKDGSLN